MIQDAIFRSMIILLSWLFTENRKDAIENFPNIPNDFGLREEEEAKIEIIAQRIHNENSHRCFA